MNLLRKLFSIKKQYTLDQLLSLNLEAGYYKYQWS